MSAIRRHTPPPSELAAQASRLLAEIDRDTATLVGLGHDALALPDAARAVLDAAASGKVTDPAKAVLALQTAERLFETNAWRALHALKSSCRAPAS
jgi:hypothetical protein